MTSTDDDEVPTAIRWRLDSAEIAVSGDVFVPSGPLYFNAFTTAERRARGLDVGSGRVAIRQDSSALSALFGGLPIGPRRRSERAVLRPRSRD